MPSVARCRAWSRQLPSPPRRCPGKKDRRWHCIRRVVRSSPARPSPGSRQPCRDGGQDRTDRAPVVGAVDCGASEMPLRSEELRTLGLVHFPLLIDGIVAMVNIDGVGPGQLHLTGQAWPKFVSDGSPGGPIRRSGRSIGRSPCGTPRSQSSAAPTAQARSSTSPTSSARQAPSSTGPSPTAAPKPRPCATCPRRRPWSLR